LKRYRKFLLVAFLMFIILIASLFPKISYGIDSMLVSYNKRPIFVIPVTSYKDGGTTIYQGIDYQVIKWNRETTLINSDGITESGIERGDEISKSPNYKNVNDGPSKKIKFISH